ncbi:MAG: hypothetical protein ACYSSO_13920 [Planctomycetota bacterium]|jgi:hypothetical protein
MRETVFFNANSLEFSFIGQTHQSILAMHHSAGILCLLKLYYCIRKTHNYYGLRPSIPFTI